VIPGNGIYAAIARVGEEKLAAAVNVGVRPTFGGTETLIEAFILDFDRDIYGSVLELEFVERLRPELAFESVEALVQAMTEDVARVRQVLKSAALAG
jgi:riboflavin kinase/FMN adenylyltransferase